MIRIHFFVLEYYRSFICLFTFVYVYVLCITEFILYMCAFSILYYKLAYLNLYLFLFLSHGMVYTYIASATYRTISTSDECRVVGVLTSRIHRWNLRYELHEA